MSVGVKAHQVEGIEAVAGIRVSNREDAVRPLGPFTKLGIVIERGAPGEWDEAMVESACPVFVPEAQKYALLYTGYSGTTAAPTNAALGIAWSMTPEGPYEKDPGNPILTGSGVSGDADQSGVTGCMAVRHDAGDWVIYSIGLNAGGYEGGVPTLCRYSTPSLAAPDFTRHGPSVAPGGTSWRQSRAWIGCLVEADGLWHLFMNGTANDGKERIGHGTAPRPEGPWTMDADPVLNVGGSGAWDSYFVGQPWVFRIGETWYMEYYGHIADGAAADGLATTSVEDFPYGWTKHPENPLLVPSESYDAKFAHKPFSLVLPDRICHFYTAVAADDTREVALAVIGRLDPAAGGGEGIAGIVVQDENGNVATDVTQIDFQGAGVAATAGTGEVVVTITGASAGTGELLMQDGVTGPPVPIETEARDDWLYSG